MDTRKSSFRLLSVLICAVSILLLAVACSSATPTPTATPVPTATPTPVPTATPTPLPTATPTPCPPSTPYPCPHDDTYERAAKVLEKYKDQINRYPWVTWTDVDAITKNRELTGHHRITVAVCRKFDQSTLPFDAHIPDCLEGIPVKMVVSSSGRYHLAIDLGRPGIEAPQTETATCNIDNGYYRALEVRRKYTDLFNRQPHILA